MLLTSLTTGKTRVWLCCTRTAAIANRTVHTRCSVPLNPFVAATYAMHESDSSTDQQQQDAAPPQASTTGQQQHPRCYVIVYNLSKKHNVGTLLRSCTAFGVAEVCLVGSRHFNSFGSHGADVHVQLRHFPTLEPCCSYLRDTAGCRIVGVEIDPTAQPVQSHPFAGNTAFMLGNEGQGLTERQMRLCDSFVYIPQHGQGTASLNVTVAASIVLHQFAVWAAYPERQREGAKFVVDPRPQRTTVRGLVPLSPEELAALRQQQSGQGDAALAGLKECSAVDCGDEWLLQAGGLDAVISGLEVS